MKLIHFTIELECLADSQDLFVLNTDVEKIMMNRTYFVVILRNKKEYLCQKKKNRKFLLSFV